MQFNLSPKPPENSNLKYYDKQQQRIFDIITGKIRFPSTDFRDVDLSPDLIIKITVPNSQYIPKHDYLELSNYVAFPSQKLQRAFQKAQKLIIEQMNNNRQNNDPNNLKIRLQKALIPCELKVKQASFLNQYNQKESLQIQAIHKHDGTLDCFSLEYNAISYILQQICGFRVRSFLLYDDKQEHKEIYLFLSLSSENLVSLAKKYRIKKQIDYTFIDFFLNDPTDRDERPLKCSSSIKTDRILLQKIKSMKRYFKVGNSQHETTDIVEQRELQDDQNIDFRDYIEQITEVFEYYKYRSTKEITNRQKSYLFEYNRRKINKGCQKLYAIIKQRQQFFQINKQVLQTYGYRCYDEPLVYQQFSVPNKQSKYSTFFQRLYALLLYKPMTVNEHGDLDLFVKMQRTKLAYLIIKNNFKVSYLKKMGFDFLTLSNNFQKFGREGLIKGGINGENLNSKWSMYGLFSDIDTIRNYVGDNIGFEILISSQLIMYFLIIVVPFALLYALEETIGSTIYIYTILFQTIIYTTSYQAYLFYWNLAQTEYIKNYSDSVSSKVFLNDYRGPYRRNILTDEVNEFQREGGFKNAGINLLCLLIITTLLVIMGAVFHGCRMLLLQIYEPLSYLKVSSLSLPHIISYLLFFVVVDLAAILATDRLISLMVYLQNPPTDEQQQQWRSTLRFFYLLGIQLIPPFFFFILEPFSSTSCYSDYCLDQIQFYVYARITIAFLISAVRLANVFLFQYLRSKQFFKEKEPIIYQDKLSALLTKALHQSKKKEHIVNINETISILACFGIYCNILPLVTVLSLIAFFMQHTNIRLGILYKKRRPINKSQRIMPFKTVAQMLFYIGLFSQAWVSVFLFQFVQNNFQEVIEKVSTMVTYQGIFLFKISSVFIYFLILLAISRMVGGLIQGYTNDALLKRKDNKFKQFIESRGRMKREIKKTRELVPVKTLFRTFNPEKTHYQMLNQLLYAEQVSIPSVDEQQDMNLDTLNHITFHN